MKICLNTHNLAGNMSVDEIIKVCKTHGIGGVEFSIGYNHKHGVEFDTPTEELINIRDKLYNNGIEIVCISTYCRFDMKEQNIIDDNLVLAKKGIDCARIIGSSNFRFVGNDLPNFMPREQFIERIAEIMKILSDYSKPFNIDVLLNMHGTLNFRKDIKKIVELCSAQNCGIVYNCSDEDCIDHSVSIVIESLIGCIKHVHLHDMLCEYPYNELFSLMNDYKGWYSMTVDEPSDEPFRFIGYYKKLAKSLYDNRIIFKC